MSQDLIFQIADALEREGKQPSVALIKSRLPEPRAIPEIISALQRWRNQRAGQTQQSAPTQESTENGASLCANPAIMPAELAPWLTPLQQELQQLRGEVAQLRQTVVQLLRASSQKTE